MAHPVPVVLAGLMTLTAVSCLGRGLRVPARMTDATPGPGPGPRTAEMTHAMMALAMAAMLVGALRGRVASTILLVVLVATLWFARGTVVEVVRGGTRALVTGHGLWLSVSSAAMALMLVAPTGSVALPGSAGGMTGMARMAGMAGMAGMGLSHAPSGSGFAPSLTLLAAPLALAVTALALAPARCRVAAAPSGGGGLTRVAVAATSCQVAMGLTMAYALLTMTG